MAKIYHIASRSAWEEAQAQGAYQGDTLQTEGFIHCSKWEQVFRVGNNYYPGRRDLILLEIDEAAVTPEIRYEAAPTGEVFPHIYGALNLEAVSGVLPFDPGADGRFGAETAK